MVCIYCGGHTRITNSRAQKRLGTTWRRRHCDRCGALFSTIEQADLSGGLRVRLSPGRLEPFVRDKLFMSIVSALGHRRDAVAAASALTATCIARLLETSPGAILEREQLIMTAHSVLADFDVPAGIHYAAYHHVI